MDHQPQNGFVAPDPQPFPPTPSTVDLTPLEFILALLALVTIPALIYTFFCSLKCPPSNPFNQTPRRSTPTTSDFHQTTSTNKEKEPVSDLKDKIETRPPDSGSKCPVCWSEFEDGTDVKQLGACSHSFHAKCIDQWLRSHPSCPVCRAFVKGSSGGDRRRASGVRRDEDFQQGLPDASALV